MSDLPYKSNHRPEWHPDDDWRSSYDYFASLSAADAIIYWWSIPKSIRDEYSCSFLNGRKILL